MMQTADSLNLTGSAHVADNIVHFARVLRAAGLPIGTDRIVAAIDAVEIVGVAHRPDVHTALSSTLLGKHDEQRIFDEAFDAFFRDPKLLERLMYLALPRIDGRGIREPVHQRSLRLEEALRGRSQQPEAPLPDSPADQSRFEFDASLTFSDRERLQSADFASMSTAEFEEAQRLVRTIRLPMRKVLSRRHRPAVRGRLDLRRSLTTTFQSPDAIQAQYSAAVRLPPPIVILLDISGSMERYTRLFLKFAHALMQQLQTVHVLTFGTSLTDISRQLRHRDPDHALMCADKAVQDWGGGTRIATSLATFNRRWARRLLAGNAAVLLLSDGLERDTDHRLDTEVARLARFSHELIWLNPLLRYDDFEPLASGVRTILPYVDRFLPMHNLRCLSDLGHALCTSAPAKRRRW